MFFKSSYSGIFRDRANRRTGFLGTSIVEVLDKTVYGVLAAIELS